MKNLHDIPREQVNLTGYWGRVKQSMTWSTERTIEQMRRFQISMERLRQYVEELARHP